MEIPEVISRLMHAIWRKLGPAFVGVLLGAFLGAFFGYLFTLYLQAQETKAKREDLLDLLRSEHQTMQSDAPQQGQIPGPISLIAARQLLDGHTLTYRSHGELIKLMLRLQSQVDLYNALLPRLQLGSPVIGAGPAPVSEGQLRQLRSQIDILWQQTLTLVEPPRIQGVVEGEKE